MSVHSFLELVKKEETNGKKKSKKKRNMQRKRLARVVGGMGQIFVPYKVQTREEGIKQNIEHNCYAGVKSTKWV